MIGALLMSLSVVFGQNDYAFKVLANKGSNEVKSGDSWTAIKTGASLNPNDELKLSDNSYIALVHNTGKPLELKKPGTYKVSDLSSSVSQQGSGVLTKYTDFILSSNSAEAKKNRLSATGAVHRGGLDQVKVYLPENQNADVFNTTAIINWEPWKNGGPYVVTFSNLFGDELAKVETPETTAQVNLANPEFANESAIIVEVRAKSDERSKSENHLIKKMAPAMQDKIKKELADFGPDFMTAESAANKILLAAFYEQNKLFIDAITAYEQAITMAPDVTQFKEDYEEFLFRNKLKIVPKQ